jgi:hypothetical protein
MVSRSAQGLGGVVQDGGSGQPGGKIKHGPARMSARLPDSTRQIEKPGDRPGDYFFRAEPSEGAGIKTSAVTWSA